MLFRSLITLRKEIVPALLPVATDPKRDSNVRSAVLCTRGLLERLDRKRKLAPSLTKDKQMQVNSAESLISELGLFLKALDLDRSPDTCFYLAEVLLELQRHAEARLYVEVALGLCATHAGALALATNWTNNPL